METQWMCRLRIMVMGHTTAATPLANPLNTQSWCPGVESISQKAHSGLVSVEVDSSLHFTSFVLLLWFCCLFNAANIQPVDEYWCWMPS